MPPNNFVFEPTDSKEITTAVFQGLDSEIYISYYTPDDASIAAIAGLQEAARNSEYTDLFQCIEELEVNSNLLPQDTLDLKGNIVAAKIEICADGSHNYYHYHRGEMYNLYDLAQSYTIMKSGKIFSSSRLSEEGITENSEQEHTAFVQEFKYQEGLQETKSILYVEEQKIKRVTWNLKDKLYHN